MNHAYLQTAAPIKLASPNLTRLYTELAKQTAAGKASDAEYRRLMKILRPDIGPSVIHHLEPATHATIDVSGPKVRANREIGGDSDEAARRADDIDRISRGEPIAERMDIQSQLDHEARKRGAIEVVIERLENEIRDERRKLAIEFCRTLKPKSDDQMKRFRKTLAEAYAVHLAIINLRQDLIASEIGFYGLDVPEPDFVRSTAAFFEDAASRGYLA